MTNAARSARRWGLSGRRVFELATVVLIVRGEHGRDGGQIALPGGIQGARDADLIATALREAKRRIGLEPGSVEILATLPDSTRRPDT